MPDGNTPMATRRSSMPPTVARLFATATILGGDLIFHQEGVPFRYPDQALAKRRRDFRKLERVADALEASPSAVPAPRTEEDNEWASQLVNELEVALISAASIPSPKPRRSIDRGNPLSEAEAAKYSRLYDRRMAQMRADGLLDEALEDGNQK